MTAQTNSTMRFEGLTSSIVSDALDQLGVRRQTLAQRLQPLAPGMIAVGRAATISFSATGLPDERAPYDAAIDFIDTLRPGELVVIGTSGSNLSAVWGELFSAAAIGRGAVGVVTDGCLRDASKVVALEFPAFSVSRSPVDYRQRLTVTGTRERLALGDVDVMPGDLVVADEDGVVVVPQEQQESVLGYAEARLAKESTVLEELVAGASLREVWERYGVL